MWKKAESTRGDPEIGKVVLKLFIFVLNGAVRRCNTLGKERYLPKHLRISLRYSFDKGIVSLDKTISLMLIF